MSAPLALIYRGPASLSGCPEAVAKLLGSSRWGFRLRYVGPKEDLQLSESVLASAVLYAQPGGGSLRRGYRKLKPHRDPLRNFVASGGRYLGFCLGGYLAGASPGLKLLPGDTDQYITTRGATIRSEEDAVVEVIWRGHRRFMFFQDGPVFRLRRDARQVEIIAQYPNQEIAALAAPYGAGRVAVVGPHPEATPDWFSDSGLVDPDGHNADLGHDLIDAVML